jgi:DNA repair photolyase
MDLHHPASPEGSPPPLVPLRGRGAAANPANRFERIEFVPEQQEPDEDAPAPRTVFLRDATRGIIARNDSPDIGFETSVNPYRGCEHGCIYCFARPFHEYLGFSAGLDFETRILVKTDAPELLRRELASKRWTPQVIVMSGVTDPYQPIERKLRLTRGCLEALAEVRNPVGIITKNHLVTRDADVLGELASHGAAAVNVSVTTLDEALQRRMEPRTSPPRKRLEAIEVLARAGIPVRVMVAPVIPGLTDHEVPAILAAAAEAGARAAAFIPLRLPHGVKDLFDGWLATHYPDRREKVLNRVRAIRGGRLYDSRFGTRLRGEGIFAEQMKALFEVTARKLGLGAGLPPLSTAAFRRIDPTGQMQLFDG